MIDQDILADDASHPIPQVGNLDVHAIRKAGGADLALVIATPMKSDARSTQRLMKKIENYLGFITSETFAKECGSPTPDNTTITVHLHPHSDPAIFRLLERCDGWLEDNHARLEIKILKTQKEPNQALEPTSGIGTSAAEQPLVPIPPVAHL